MNFHICQTVISHKTELKLKILEFHNKSGGNSKEAQVPFPGKCEHLLPVFHHSLFFPLL